MNIVRSSRLLTKLVALAALMISISYLQKPEALYGLTCRQECQAFLKSCLKGCGTNSICQENCISSYKNCVTGCP